MADPQKSQTFFIQISNLHTQENIFWTFFQSDTSRLYSIFEFLETVKNYLKINKYQAQNSYSS